tara:strand:+ start:24 stop:386 length:363 start_codon:yes stop_codon:yes gene_type:complete
MATLTPTLTLTSTDATGDELNVTVTDSLTTTNPNVNIARVSVATTGAEVIIASSVSTTSYVYLKNTDSTNIIVVKNDGGDNISDLGPGEFAFFPLKGATGLECTSVTAACVLEYGYWTKS